MTDGLKDKHRWNQGTLKELADLVMGQSPAGTTCNTFGEGLPLLNGPTEFDSAHPIPVQFTTDPRKTAEPNDLLFCVRGSTTGRMNWADQRYAIGRGLAAIRTKNDPSLRYFVKAIIDLNLSKLLATATGSTFPNVNKDQIENIECLIPPLPTQKAIAHILGTLDDRIELNRKMNRTLEAMAAAIFKSWFVDFDPVRAKAQGRDPGLPPHIANLFPDSFQDSELGEIPEGWGISTLKNLADVNARSIKRDYHHDEIQYVDISSVRQGKLDQTTVYALADAPSRARRLVKSGDTIWSCVRPNHKAYLYIDQPSANLVVSTGFAVLSPKKVPASYLHQWVTTQSFVDYLTAHATGAAYPAVKADTFENANMLFPPRAVLTAFNDIVGSLRTRIAHNQSQSRPLATLRDTLLPKLLNGELDIAAVESAIGRSA